MRDPLGDEPKEPYLVRGEQLKALLDDEAEVDTELMNRCDIAYDGVAAASAINFNPSFGKISMGEYCRVILTLQNINTDYTIEELKINSTVMPNYKDEAAQKQS
mmetsp:Transcript_36864/g.56430  ORF Transcript_36864/g.56430 Transcript_36864/m.56430 type:complete len:104 (+) Transcript_36864:102-413(+)